MIKGKARNIEENINYQSELDNILTLAKQAYENYIIRSNNQDLETAIDCYIKVMNLDPNIPETYYKPPYPLRPSSWAGWPWRASGPGT